MEITMALPHTGKLPSPEAISRVAEEAERMGCATVWVLERLLRPAGGSMPDHYATVYDHHGLRLATLRGRDALRRLRPRDDRRQFGS